MIRQGTISHTAGKKVFDEVLHTGASPEKAIEKLGLTQVSDASTLDLMVQRVLEENPAEVQKFLSGHEKVLGFLMGQIMKASQGKANPGLVNEILKKKLGNMA